MIPYLLRALSSSILCTEYPRTVLYSTETMYGVLILRIYCTYRVLVLSSVLVISIVGADAILQQHTPYIQQD